MTGDGKNSGPDESQSDMNDNVGIAGVEVPRTGAAADISWAWLQGVGAAAGIYRKVKQKKSSGGQTKR